MHDVGAIRIDGRKILRESLASAPKSRKIAAIAQLFGLARILKLDVRDLRKEMADLRDRLTRGLASNRIWMLLQSAAILGVMARGFKWL